MDKLHRIIDKLEEDVNKKFHDIAKKVVELETMIEYSNMEKEKVKKTLRGILKLLEKGEKWKIEK